ncbi:hypothetical protein GOODEAATRI_033993, partial [Goodea atripinnis]
GKGKAKTQAVMVKGEERPNASSTIPTAPFPDVVHPSQVGPPNFPTASPPHPVVNVYPMVWNTTIWSTRKTAKRIPMGIQGTKCCTRNAREMLDMQ